jgi:mono/diheme cytochrome c family protein
MNRFRTTLSERVHHLKMKPTLALTLLLLPLPTRAASVDFARDVRPIFQKHCHSCHGTEKQKGGLRLDIKAAALKGGDEHAPNIVPGNPKNSPLLRFVKGDEPDLWMPPKGERLTPEQTGILERWISEGASWPDGLDTAQLSDKRDHWSLKPVSKPTPPLTRQAAWARDGMDHFILSKLEREGLAPSPEADRAVWLRRVSFDLTGLPPTPSEQQAFLTDETPDAHERVVERLLQSERHGEHWAQLWLDVVRYADTHGFEVNTERPNAWPYRDYVIRALNADTPYDRFIKEQIAGDALGTDAATGFLVTASVLLPGQIGQDEPSKRLARQDSLDEIVVNTSQTFLGLTVGCARCHDHKFDAVSSRDYYAFQSFFAGVEYRDRESKSPEALAAKKEEKLLRTQLDGLDRALAEFVPFAGSGVKRPGVHAKKNTDRFEPTATKRLRFTIEKTNSLEPCIDELEIFNTAGTNIALATAGATVTASGQKKTPNRHDLLLVNDGRYGNSSSWMSDQTGKGWLVVEFPAEQTVDRVVWGRDREGKLADRLPIGYRIEIEDASGTWRLVADSTDRNEPSKEAPADNDFSTQGLSPERAKRANQLAAERRALNAKLAATASAQRVFAGAFRAPDPIYLLHRGDPEQPREQVVPAVLSALGTLNLSADAPEQERRLALANWIAHPNNPLTARVMVNRIWQGHFGAGLVETSSDFGKMGLRPSHPELLDWLASEFIRSGWSMRALHKKIVLSSTYRQSSASNPVAEARDADGRLLWRFPPRRLTAENIRDTMLAVGGRLDLSMYGSGFNLFNQRGGLSGFKPVESFSGSGLRRMIYAHKVRREPEAVFGAFDCPDAGLSTSRRRESTTPIQALNLFNSTFTLEQSEAFAARLLSEAGTDPAAQIEHGYLLALGRSPSPTELEETVPVVRSHGAAALCRALFNCNEFLFVP